MSVLRTIKKALIGIAAASKFNRHTTKTKLWKKKVVSQITPKKKKKKKRSTADAQTKTKP